MALNEATQRKLRTKEIIRLALENQYKYDSTLTTINDIKGDLSELRKYCKKLESDLIVTKQVNTKLCDQMRFLVRQSWENEHLRYLVLQNLSLINDLEEKLIWKN